MGTGEVQREREKIQGQTRLTGVGSPYIKLRLASDNHSECPILRTHLKQKKRKSSMTPQAQMKISNPPRSGPGSLVNPVQGSDSIRMGNHE